MRIAVSTDGDYVSEHFGRCPSFTLADMENGKIVHRENIANPGHNPGFIPQFMKEKGVNCIIAGGMGMRAKTLFDEMGISTIMAVGGLVTDVLEKIREGKLVGGESQCIPGAGKGYGIDKTECSHPDKNSQGKEKGITGDDEKTV